MPPADDAAKITARRPSIRVPLPPQTPPRKKSSQYHLQNVTYHSVVSSVFFVLVLLYRGMNVNPPYTVVGLGAITVHIMLWGTKVGKGLGVPDVVLRCDLERVYPKHFSQPLSPPPHPSLRLKMRVTPSLKIRNLNITG